MNHEILHTELMNDEEYREAFAEEDLIHRVALRVLQYREAYGISQEKLAELLGTKQPAIARIEAGEANMTLRRVARIAHALGLDDVALLVTKESPRSKAMNTGKSRKVAPVPHRSWKEEGSSFQKAA